MFKEIKATDIKENIVDLLKNNWGLVTAGNNEKYNMMTVSWGAMGELWGKDCLYPPSKIYRGIYERF